MNLVEEFIEQFTDPLGDSKMDFLEVMILTIGAVFLKRAVIYALLMLLEESLMDL